MDNANKYLPEHLVGDIFVADARIACQYVFRHHISRNLFFYLSYVNSGGGKLRKETIVNDNESTSVNSETTKTSQMHVVREAAFQLLLTSRRIHIVYVTDIDIMSFRLVIIFVIKEYYCILRNRR